MLNTFMLSIFLLKHFFLYRERDLNPHSHHWPKDFKSFVSTDSTIAAQNRCKGTTKIANMQKKSQKMVIFRNFVKSLVCTIAVLSPFFHADFLCLPSISLLP